MQAIHQKPSEPFAWFTSSINVPKYCKMKQNDNIKELPQKLYALTKFNYRDKSWNLFCHLLIYPFGTISCSIWLVGSTISINFNSIYMENKDCHLNFIKINVEHNQPRWAINYSKQLINVNLHLDGNLNQLQWRKTKRARKRAD